MEKADILNILKTGKLVFTFKEILLSSRETNPALLKRRISYYVKTGQIYPIRRGIYARDKTYNKYELATRIFTPSYISFETVLAQAGIVFQYYGQIFIASYQTREVICDGQTYVFRKIKDAVLTHQAGIENTDNYSIASAERAFLDTVYLSKNYYFDHLSPLDWDKVFEILPIYDNKKMTQRVNQYYKSIRSEGE